MTVIKKLIKIKEFSPNFNELKRQAPNSFGLYATMVYWQYKWIFTKISQVKWIYTNYT